MEEEEEEKEEGYVQVKAKVPLVLSIWAQRIREREKRWFSWFGSIISGCACVWVVSESSYAARQRSFASHEQVLGTRRLTDELLHMCVS